MDCLLRVIGHIILGFIVVNEIRSGYSSKLFVVEKTFSFVWNYCQWILVVWLVTHFTQIDFVLVFVDFRRNPGDAIHRVVVYPPVNSCKVFGAMTLLSTLQFAAVCYRLLRQNWAGYWS